MPSLALRLLAVALVSFPWAPACARRPQTSSAEYEAARSELMERVKEGKERWAWGGDPAQAPQERAALESILRAGNELWEAFTDRSLTRPIGVRSNEKPFSLPAGGADPNFETEDAHWLREQLGLERVRVALMEGLDDDFSGEVTGEPPVRPTNLMQASGMLAIAHRRLLEAGEHKAFFQGLEATQELASVLLQLQDSHLSMTGFWLLRVRWIGDELGRLDRKVPWTRADALRLQEMAGRALAALTPDVRPLRYTFWDTIEIGLNGGAGEATEPSDEVLFLASEFASREAALMKELEALWKLPLLEARKTVGKIEEEEGKVLDYWYWSSATGYLHALVSARSEIETLRLALEVSLTGEPATAMSSRGHEIHAAVNGDFAVAEEADFEGTDEWIVRVPLVKQ